MPVCLHVHYPSAFASFLLFVRVSLIPPDSCLSGAGSLTLFQGTVRGPLACQPGRPASSRGLLLSVSFSSQALPFSPMVAANRDTHDKSVGGALHPPCSDGEGGI